MTLRTTSAFLILALLAVGVGVAQPRSAAATPAPPSILPWAHGLPAAQAEAKARNVPLLVLLVLEGERGNEAMLEEVHGTAAVREAVKKCVITIASIANHAEVDDAASGRKVCSRFGCLTCAEHRATEEVVRRDWLKKGPKDDIFCPRHIFRGPDGRLLFERVQTLDLPELVKLIDRAVAYSTPESLATWDTVPARLKRASDLAKCVRQTALADLLLPKDPAIDAQVFDLIRKAEISAIAEDAVNAIAADMTPPRAEGLRRLLAAPSAKTRMRVIAALLGQKGQATFDAIAAALTKEKSPEVLSVLLRALPLAGGDPLKTREILLKAAKGGEPEPRTHAIVALEPWATEDAVVEAVRKLPLNEKLPENLRAAACWLLGLSGRKDIAAELQPVTEERGRTLKSIAEGAIARLATGTDDQRYLQAKYYFAPLGVDLR